MAQVIDLTGNDEPRDVGGPLVIRLEVMGKPVAQPRARKGKYSRLYNPASRKKKAFQELVKTAIPATQHGPLFGQGVPVAMVVVCYQPRPKCDFKGGNRLAGFLKAMVPSCRPICPDIDNLAKFVLDALNGLVYHDDRQVVKLLVYKLLDSEGSCEGRTLVEVKPFDERNVM